MRMNWSSRFSDCKCAGFLLAGILGCIAAVYIFRRKKNRRFPPGPRGIPLVGYVPFLGHHAAETLRKLKSKYGPVMSVQLGMDDWVVLNDFDAINEALVKQGEKFSGRPPNTIMDMVTWRKGVAFADYGRSWKQLRKFGLMTLRGFGVGKKGMEENVIEETPYLLEELMKNNQDFNVKITSAVSNIICRVTFGSRYDYDDPDFARVTRVFREFFSDSITSQLFGIITGVPILRYFPIFRGAFKEVMTEVDAFLDFLRNIMKEHQASFDRDNVRDFIDAFLVEMHQRGPHDESFNEKQLIQYMRDLFEAGTATTSSTLTWGLLALLTFPACQVNIAEEIEKTIGDSGIPSMKHQEQMNYTCAFIHELMRHRTLTPTSLTHKTNENAVLHGYTIPKDTPIIPNIWAVHHDPDLFENPTEFKPERFLDQDGKFIKSNRVIPFSVGPRHCLGEQLARMEIFIFLTGIVQKLKVLPDPSHPPPPLTSGALPLFSTYDPPHFRIIFERR